MSGSGINPGALAAGDLLGAAGDIFSGLLTSSGDTAAEKAYEQAATYAGENAQVAQRSGAIQEAQLNRQVYQVASGQSAAEASGGVGAGGSSQYLTRATQQQGGLAKAVVANQTQLNVQGFEAEESADIGQAKEAGAQASAATGGGIFGALGGIAGALGAIIGV